MSSMNSKETQINLEALKLNVGFGDGLPEKKKLTTVLVCKPPKQTYIRVHPDSEWELKTAVLELKADGETYLVAKHLWEELQNEITPKIILSAITRQNTFFLWPIRLPKEDGWLDSWNRSAIECAKLAQIKWVRIQSDKDAQSYSPFVAENQDNLPDPEWPDIGFDALLKLAFKDFYIDSMDHLVIKKLRGIV